MADHNAQAPRNAVYTAKRKQHFGIATRRFWFTDENGGQDEPTPEDTDTAPGKEAGEPSTGETFTQADVDRIVGDRAKRAERAAREKLLQELGFDNPDDAKTLVEEARKRREAEMTAAEKAQAEAERAKKEAEEARAELQRLQEKQRASHRERVVQEALRKAGGNAADDLYIILNTKRGDDIAALFGDDNSADSDKLQSFVKSVQSDYPNFFGNPGAGSPSNNNGMPPTSRKRAEQEALKEIKSKFGSL